ncbi:phosphatidate cytidylyltransferase [Rhizopus delemar RA 99-880]|uniref:Phosphatidate cytidylyltransferase n=1 Tax=Rhizopus delemar (strain RA 99-880 / ATCC MYA-4621 / FGSC 9543 / NRRL 43880) TaxID=246409 RepID=I1C039_RHIO9|nr:phosphatidate cytidylyltransferase [Rhizopus delemar RA 99-880]|eukprot:EIE81819.1 phosphatidate cytidylyltransferase [Rhizopus delemar RA 99-880]
MSEVKKREDDVKKYTQVPMKGGWEIPRKLFHFSIDTSDVYPKLVALLSIVGTAELLRFNFEWFNVIYCHVLGPLMRTTEIKTRINGVVYYLLDPVASICGKLWGKYTLQYGGKSLAGSLGAITIGSLVTYAYFGPLSNYHALSYNSITSPIPLIILSIYGGLVAGFSEGIGNSMFGLDDNLTIPVLSGILLWTPLIGFSLGQ